MLDSETEMLDTVSSGPTRDLFDSQNLISGLDGTGGVGNKYNGISA